MIGNLKTLEDADVIEEIILNWTLRKLGCEKLKLILLNQNRAQRSVFVITAMSLLIHRNEEMPTLNAAV
jgi:hypothetical protein